MENTKKETNFITVAVEEFINAVMQVNNSQPNIDQIKSMLENPSICEGEFSLKNELNRKLTIISNENKSAKTIITDNDRVEEYKIAKLRTLELFKKVDKLLNIEEEENIYPTSRVKGAKDVEDVFSKVEKKESKVSSVPTSQKKVDSSATDAEVGVRKEKKHFYYDEDLCKHVPTQEILKREVIKNSDFDSVADFITVSNMRRKVRTSTPNLDNLNACISEELAK